MTVNPKLSRIIDIAETAVHCIIVSGDIII